MGKDTSQIPVGLERVLYLAATEPAFRAALEADPERAVQERGMTLRPSELAMLRAVPPAMLTRHADGVDPSADNLKRRSFLRAVAASAVTVSAAGQLGGCKKKKIVTMAGIAPRQDAGADMGRDAEMEGGASGDGKMEGTLPSPDLGPPAGTGIRPGDAGTHGEK